MYVISDVHACCCTLLKLLKRLPRESHKCFVGDLIDRGKNSFETVALVQAMCERGEASCVMGNHDEFMVELDWGANLWGMNGGGSTWASYEKQSTDKFHQHREWMEKLPTYLEFKDVICPGNRYLVVSHSYIFGAWKDRDNDEGKHDILWGRHFQGRFDKPLIYNVIGHTPQEEFLFREWGAMIDMGCVYSKGDKYSVLTALNPETGSRIQEFRDRRDL